MGRGGRGEGRRCTSFVGAVVSGVAVCVVEEEGAEEGGHTEDGRAVVSVGGLVVMLVWYVYLQL